MRTNAATPPLLAAAILLLPPLLYVAGYYSLLDLSAPWQYRLGGQVSFRLFWPIEQIDRKLRPSFWGLDQFRKPISGIYIELYQPSPSIVPAEDDDGCKSPRLHFAPALRTLHQQSTISPRSRP